MRVAHIHGGLCLDTIEERIDAILAAKRLLFQELVDDVSLDLTRALTRAELFGLFDLLPGGQSMQ
ncbi:MAG: hypothetical protein HYU66_20165 [Armatimonadetes bacterium]|nr:hypothetical protein [Armatimonadota bacterium]